MVEHRLSVRTIAEHRLSVRTMVEHGLSVISMVEHRLSVRPMAEHRVSNVNMFRCYNMHPEVFPQFECSAIWNQAWPFIAVEHALLLGLI